MSWAMLPMVASGIWKRNSPRATRWNMRRSGYFYIPSPYCPMWPSWSRSWWDDKRKTAQGVFLWAVLFLSKLYWVLSHRYLVWLCQLVNFVVDIVRQVWHITLVCPEVQEVQDGTWWRLDHHLTRLAARRHHLHLHILAEWWQPKSTPCLNDEEIIVALHTSELCALIEQPLYGSVSSSGVMREFKGCCLHKIKIGRKCGLLINTNISNLQAYMHQYHRCLKSCLHDIKV